MPQDVLLGIDLGTTTLKVAAVGASSGRLLALASATLPVQSAPDGKREQRLADVDAALSRLTAAVRRKLGKDWIRVAGVGLAAQGGSAIIADAATGKGLTAMQLWNDSRPLGLLPAIASFKPVSYWKRLSYLSDPGAGLARIAWLRRCGGGEKLFRKGNIYIGAGEYAYFKLTGLWRQDAGNALQIGCYDARRGELTDEPLALVGLDRSFVAPMRQGHQTHPLTAAGARLLHLPPGLPVAGPYIDQEAGYLSAAAASPRPLQLSLGTAWVGNFVCPRSGIPREGFNLVLPSPAGPGAMVIRVMHAGTVSWDWAVQTCLGGLPGATAAAEAVFRRRLLPPPALTAMPWLTLPNALDRTAAGSGGFVGLSPHTGPDDMLRAMAAGLCYELTRVFESVLWHGRSRDVRATVDAAVLTGGAANGWQFRRMLAGLLTPLPVLQVAADEPAAARGSLWAFSKQAAAVAVRPCPPPPAAERKALAQGLGRYRRLCDVLSKGLGPAAADLLT
ncbi:MAG: hypothetical protein LLG01_17800 [Planctomycetaceae bacterium]|nr:hypothetical protein [Planctomycetaceae bacterium]